MLQWFSLSLSLSRQAGIVGSGSRARTYAGKRAGLRSNMVRRGPVDRDGESVELGEVWQDGEATRYFRLQEEQEYGGLLSTHSDRWERFVQKVIDNDREAARAFIVCRARRIWGRLGVKLRHSRWAQHWRASHLIPVRILTYVKKWVARTR